jgi:hypothetical protein
MVMRRANEETHSSLVKQRKETKRVKQKVQSTAIPVLKFVPSALPLFYLLAVVSHASEGARNGRDRCGKDKGLSLFPLHINFA